MPLEKSSLTNSTAITGDHNALRVGKISFQEVKVIAQRWCHQFNNLRSSFNTDEGEAAMEVLYIV